jgi:hypothetical protein
LLLTIARRAAAAGSVEAHEDVRAAFAALTNLDGADADDNAPVPRCLHRMAVELLSIASENVAMLEDEPTLPQINFIVELRQQLKTPPLSRDASRANYTKNTFTALLRSISNDIDEGGQSTVLIIYAFHEPRRSIADVCFDHPSSRPDVGCLTEAKEETLSCRGVCVCAYNIMQNDTLSKLAYPLRLRKDLSSRHDRYWSCYLTFERVSIFVV